MLDENQNDKVAEKCVYQADKAGGILYEVYLYKNPGWKSYLRKKCFNWGVDKMNELVKKERKIMSDLTTDIKDRILKRD